MRNTRKLASALLVVVVTVACDARLPGVPAQPAVERAEPVRVEAVTLSDDRRSVRLDFVGGPEFAPDNPCSVAYQATARVVGDELEVAVFPEQHPMPLPEGHGCSDAGHSRTVVVSLDEPFGGTRVRDLAGQVIRLAPPAESSNGSPVTRASAAPPTPPQPSPTVIPTPLPGEFGAGPWGPLAVIEAPSDAGELAGLAGRLHIGERCVTVGDMHLTMPIFRHSQTRWEPDGGVIVFYNVHDGTRVELRDGDRISFGGGEIGVDPAELPWLAPPDPSCPAQVFAVHSVHP